MTTTTPAARAALGAAHLDQIRPGWAEEIDLDTLDIANPCLCVIGQLGPRGAWYTESAEVVLDEPFNARRQEELGFDVEGALEHGSYPALLEAWTLEIQLRRIPCPVCGVTSDGGGVCPNSTHPLSREAHRALAVGL